MDVRCLESEVSRSLSMTYDLSLSLSSVPPSPLHSPPRSLGDKEREVKEDDNERQRVRRSLTANYMKNRRDKVMTMIA